MQLTLTQCTIRPWRLDDAESLVRHANNRKVWIALRDVFPHPYRIEDAHTFLKSVTTSEPVTLFCIEVDSAAVGGIGIRIGADVHRQTAELGYWLGEEFWRGGIMTEAVAASPISASKTFSCGEFMQSRSGITPPPRECWKKQDSLLKDGSKATF